MLNNKKPHQTSIRFRTVVGQQLEEYMKNLVLYYKPTCPFCQKVLAYLDERKIDIEKRDILQDQQALEELINVGGKKQVPCLFIDDKPLYESNDIISYIAKNL